MDNVIREFDALCDLPALISALTIVNIESISYDELSTHHRDLPIPVEKVQIFAVH